MENSNIIELYRGDLWECQLRKSILKDSGIFCFLKNSHRAGYFPIVAPAQMVIVMIKESDLEKARTVLQNQFT
ncbi:MAG: DUF2007 domain-containing protein [Bacteroidaceae bacterium]|jgi:hypothetical protein